MREVYAVGALMIILAIIYMLFIWSFLRIASEPTPKIIGSDGGIENLLMLSWHSMQDRQVYGQGLVMQQQTERHAQLYQMKIAP